MQRSRFMLMAGFTIIALIIIVILMVAALTPQNTHPAFAVATDFVNAAVKGDDATALPLLNDALQTYVQENCPDGKVSACVQDYTPDEWGGLMKAVFRRSVPDGPSAWDIDLIATYEHGVGFSGVCIYTRVEEIAPDDWRVSSWAGFLHCGDSASRNMASNPETPNRVP